MLFVSAIGLAAAQPATSGATALEVVWLAEPLADHGVAVLRFDERGVGAAEGVFDGATSADFALDVEAAIAYLTGRPEIEAMVLTLAEDGGALEAPLVESYRTPPS